MKTKAAPAENSAGAAGRSGSVAVRFKKAVCQPAGRIAFYILVDLTIIVFIADNMVVKRFLPDRKMCFFADSPLGLLQNMAD